MDWYTTQSDFDLGHFEAKWTTEALTVSLTHPTLSIKWFPSRTLHCSEIFL